MPECATEVTPEILQKSMNDVTLQNSSVTSQQNTNVTNSRTAHAMVNTLDNNRDTSLSYDAPPFVPRSLITETKLLAAFKQNASVSSSEFDSGCDTSAVPHKSENEDIPFVKPDEDLTKRIVDQVEFYFSDENIVKDAFLLKHVKRNKEGFVSLKLISSFKRVKHLSKDWRVVAFALAKSEKLQINEQGTKIRRVDPLPAYDQTTPSRTIVAINIPAESATIETVAEMFKPCGEIALIRLLRPGNPIPSDVRHFVNKHPEMNGNINALIEFVRTESAHNAINKTDWSAGLTVMELNAPASKVKRERVPKKLSMIRHHVYTDSSDYTSSCASGSEAENKFLQRRCSSPQMFPEGNHWVQRKWSRDSGSDSPGSNFSRSRSNSNAGYYIPPDRRVSVGWDSSSSDYSARSRSNSGASAEMRRYSTSSRDSNTGECCCCSGHRVPDAPDRRYSFSKQFQPHQPPPQHQSMPPHTHHEDLRRKDSGDFFCMTRSRSSSSGSQGFPERRVSFNDNFRSRTSSTSSGPDAAGFRRSSFNRDPVCQRQNVPENLVRLPRGPDGSRGFQLIDYSIHE